MSELSSVLFCHHFQWTHPGLELLHPPIELHLHTKAQALVGLNGCGKSLLLRCLAGECGGLTYQGEIHWQQPFYYLSQQEPPLSQRISTYLGMDKVLEAILRVEAGSTEQADFDCIGDRWLARTELIDWLLQLGLPAEADTPLVRLSGGQLMKLRLAKAFATGHFLLLDEVSNHLDQQARVWLHQQLQQYKAGYLLVSHDQELLSQVECIYQLSPLGLEKYQGNYQQFLQQSQRQQQQLHQQNDKLKKQQQRQQYQQQLLLQRQQQKHQRAKKNSLHSNQAAILLGKKAQQAEQSRGRLQLQIQAQQQQSSAQREQIQRQLDYRQLPTLPVPAAVQHCSGPLIACQSLVLPFGTTAALSFQVELQQRCLVTGPNGSGKSTLLKVLSAAEKPVQGLLQIKQPLWYLDQHLSIVNGFDTAVDAVMTLCPGRALAEVRTALSGIGLSAQRLTLATTQLSGGERMKLLLLVLALQPYSAFLLLDEADNHLDFQALAMLTRFLQHYPAGFILVTHQPELWQSLQFSLRLELIVPDEQRA